MEIADPTNAAYNFKRHEWVGQCPHGDVCSGCDARGYCTRMEGASAATSTSVLEVLADEFNARPAALLVLTGRELASAMAKFKPFNSGHEGWAVIREELDELWENVKANDIEGGEAFMEAIQVAAMALRFAHDLSGLSAWEVASDG